MSTRLITTFLFLFSVGCSLGAQQIPPGPHGDGGHMEVRNRVLATVNGEPITAVDLVDRLNRIFSQQFPQFTDSEEMRYQFFDVNWRNLLIEQINAMAVRSDAIERKVPVNPGLVRREITERFGPDVLGTLDKLGLTYEEAFDLVRDDILVRRITQVRVNNPAFAIVTPARVKEAYEEYVAQASGKRRWNYRVVSFRAEDIEKAEAAARAVHQKLAQNDIPLDELMESSDWDSDVTVSVSPEYERSSDDIAASHLEIVSNLDSGTYSEPTVQDGRSGKVARIYFVSTCDKEEVQPFDEMEVVLKNKLMDKELVLAHQQYLEYLHGHFDIVDESGGPPPFVWVQ